MSEAEILDKAYSRKTKRYTQSKTFDNTTHSNLIKKVMFSHHMDSLLCLEQSSSKLKFYSTDCQEIYMPGQKAKKLVIQTPQEDNQPQFILDFTISEYLNLVISVASGITGLCFVIGRLQPCCSSPEIAGRFCPPFCSARAHLDQFRLLCSNSPSILLPSQIALVTSDRQLLFFENSKAARLLKHYKLDVLQTGIWYLDLHRCWISAGADYNIRIWNFDDAEDGKKIKEDKLFLAHMKQITDICELQSPRLIASSSLDGTIKVAPRISCRFVRFLATLFRFHFGIRERERERAATRLRSAIPPR